MRLGATVTGVDLDSRVVRLGEQQVSFTKLVLAPGSSSKPLPDVPDGSELYYLRSFADLQRLHEAAGHARTAAVIGSGFIGCEAAISLAMRGIDVTMISPEPAPQQSRLGEHAAGVIAGILRGYGVDVRAGTEIGSLHAPRTLHLSDGTTLEPDLILAAVGAAPATGFLDPAALQLHEGRVVVDSHMRTLVDGVYAVGDAARAENALTGRPLPVEHWDDADSMGQVAGADAAGTEARWDAVPGFWTQLGEHTLMYSAWGDGFDAVQIVERPGGFTAWYGTDGALVGVLAYNAEDDYDRGRALLVQGATLEAAVHGAQPDSADDEGA
ncbi:NAD(P)/FAD-dependent oxidoreductase [Cumulibacter manganitolerans]|uniref:NAD(P)/FAD-dependent oxidoreductase n=1 Tax=Cumulibacter manganitolerans TaxID=1884992 RepID=UPI001E4EDFE8|nr:FAD-dependent oxidoreductase [Cumulibacter manganitolerans]